MSDDNNHFLDESCVTCDLSVPFMYEVAKDYGYEGVEFEIDGRGRCQGWEDLVERFMCGGTEDLQQH